MKVAVAGGSGFIGRHVVAALREAGHTAVVLARHVEAGASEDGVERRRADVGAEPPDLSACDAVINLVGIKVARGSNTWRRAHVDAVANLVTAMKGAGLSRLVHVSVVALPESLSPYAATKAEGERVATDSGLDVTIIRPALVIGPGDDATTNLVQFVRLAPVFPVSTGELGPLSPTDVRDVAAAVVAALDRDDTIGEAIDVVGPEALDLRALVRRVADALQLPTWLMPMPAAAQRLAAAVMERLPGDPILTTGQLAMLSHGLTGDRRASTERLGVTARGLPPARIRELSQGVRSLAPSVRVAPTAEHRRWLAERVAAVPALTWLVPLALASMLLLPSVVPNVWVRMAAIDAGLAALAIVAIPALRWRELLAPTPAAVLAGLAGAAVLYGGCALGFAALSAVTPTIAAGASVLYGWPDLLDPTLQLPLLVATVVAEDVIWRAAVTVPLAARYGPALGIGAGATLFAVAHATSGPPLLWLAALCCGAFWSALLIRTRSLTAAVVSHLAFDLVALYALPFA